MTSLVRLYPQAWRDRYEPEFLDVLESRPPSAGDRLDIVRGAIDARLHPEIPGSPTGARRELRPAWLAGLSAVAGGLAYLAWAGLILLEFRGWDGAEPEHASLGLVLSGVTLLALAVAHVAIALTSDGSMRRFGGPAASAAAVCFTLGAFAGGPLISWALIASIALAAAVAGRTIPVAVAAIWIGTTVLTLAAMLAFVAGNGRDTTLLAFLLPLGLSWILVGAVVTLRGMPARTREPDVESQG
jgi:hypothetical protein